MNVLHVISDTYNTTGPANSLLTLLDSFPLERYNSAVALRETGSLHSELEKRGVQNFTLSLPKPAGLNALFFCLNLPLAVVKMVAFIKRNKIDLIHVHQSQSLWGLIAGKVAGVPVVFHVREIMRNRNIQRLILSLSTRIVAISRAVENSFSQLGSPSSREKISVVYNAVDLDRFDPAKQNSSVRNKWGVPEQVPLVLLVSKLIGNKGHLDFIRSYSLVKEKFPEVEYMIVGGEMPGHEAYAQEVRSLVTELGHGDTIHLAGSQSDVVQFLAASDIVVQPSTCEEGLGRVPIEAMALAKPVVATAVGGIPEVVVDGETGYLVPKHDPNALSGGILKLLGDSELRKNFGQAGYNRAHSLFNAPKHVDLIAQIYDELIG